MNIIKLSMSKWHIKTTMPFISLGRAGENNSCQILFDVDKVMESNATTIVAYFLDIYDNDNATSRRSQLLDTDISSLRLFTMLGRQFLGKQGIKTLQVRCIVTDRKGNELRTYLSNKLNVQVEAGYSSTSHFDSSIILAQLSDRIQYLTDDVDDLRTHGIPQDVLKDTIIRYFSDNPIDTLTEDEVNEIISIYVTNHKADMPKGDKGDKGDNGQDAYELAVEQGFKGTEEQWLESLHGKDGKNGVNGTTPIKGTDYWTTDEVSQVIEDIVNKIQTYILNNKADFKGQDGIIGKDGKSAYDIALENGFSGDETAWLNSLKGENGLSSYEIAVKNGFVGTEQEFIKSLKGKQGNVGKQGEKGENGKSAYQVAVDNGFNGTETEWLESLRGKDGKDGQDGVNGKNGVNGKDGSNGKNGVNGLSAYEIAVKNGFTGSESLWLKSLKGEKGDKGDDGNVGSIDMSSYAKKADLPNMDDYISDEELPNAIDTYVKQHQTEFKGEDGKNGLDGLNGKSAYELAVENGFTGTEEEWLKSLKGADGTPYDDTEIKADINDVWKANGELGAKNLLVYPYFGTSNNYEGIEFIDSNGAITINGIPSTNAYYNLRPQEPIYLKNGKYIISTSTSLGNGIYLQVIYNDGSGEKSLASITRDITSQEFIITDDIISTATYWVVRIAVLANTQVDNFTVYPMIRLATDLDDTWQPYAPTNKELADKQNDIAAIMGEYLPIAGGFSGKKRSVAIGATTTTFYAGNFLSKYNITSSDIVLDVSAETASGNVVTYNNITVANNGTVTITFDELTEAATFVCKASKIN